MANNQNRRVWLNVTGPRALLRGERVIVFTGTNQTWDQFFRRKLGMVLNNTIRICTSSYRRRNPGRGYCARLTDQIGDFIGSFTNRRGMYNVKIFSVCERRGRRGHRGENAQDGNVQNVAQARLANFNPQFLLVAQAEIEALITNGLLQRIVERAPLSSWFVQSILRRN